MMKIHTEAMQPLVDLMESNREYHLLQKMEEAGKEVPSFRHNALRTKFCGHLEIICEYFRDHGSLKTFFNIKRMLDLLDYPGWEQVPPFRFYLDPLKDALTAVRERLLRMHEKTPLRCKYFIEKNTKLMALTCEMVDRDYVAQWLMEDQLRRD